MNIRIHSFNHVSHFVWLSRGINENNENLVAFRKTKEKLGGILVSPPYKQIELHTHSANVNFAAHSFNVLSCRYVFLFIIHLHVFVVWQ